MQFHPIRRVHTQTDVPPGKSVQSFHTQTDVPPDKLNIIVAGFKAQAAVVETKLQDDGNYTVIATFETPPTGKPLETQTRLQTSSTRMRQALTPAPSETSPSGKSAVITSSENLLKHIPGEASGFYLLAVDSFEKPTLGVLGLIFALAFILLVTVRWLSNASRGIMITTVIAFFLWMLILDKGFLHVLLPGLFPPPLGFIVAAFYSAFITVLANAGKIK